ncbi:MAG TPA: primase-helicase family protein [Gammaproteobacteria bacterium]|nr:primase-helicase family protein [Gammaproteobacteria bacterium]
MMTKDYRSRKLSFQRTWQKAAEGENVIAGATLAKITGDAALLNKLYLLLSDSPDISILDEFSSRFAIWSGPGIIIDIEAASLGAARPFMTRQQFINSFGHKWIESNGKRKLVADILFGLQTTQRLAGVTFEPGAGSLVETHQGKKINQWCGFAIEPYNEPVKELDIAPFLTYIHEVICSNDERIERWVLAWLSHIFQEPSKKAGTALVLVGLPGIGKSFLGEHFLIPIIGSHSVTTSSADRAAQGFNALFDNKIYVQCDEAISSRQRITAARLKSLITDPTLIIEPKGIDPYEKPNHMRMLFTSNEIHDAVFLSDGIHDRRYTVIQVSDIHRADSQYWVPLARWSTNQTNLSKVHRFLLDYSYQDSFIRFPLSTAAKVLMQEHSMSKFDQWLSAWVSRRHPLSEKAHEKWYDSPVGSSTEVDRSEWPHMINYAALTRDLWLDYRIRLTENQIRRELMRRGFKIESIPQRLAVRDFDEKEKRFISQRIYLYAIPDKKAVELYLAGKYGVPEEKEEFQEFEGISLGNGKEF